MVKVLFFGCLFIVFFLIMIPNVNSIGFQIQKEIIKSEAKIMDFSSFLDIVGQISKDEARVILNSIIKNYSYNEEFCTLLAIYFIVTLPTIFIPLGIFVTAIFSGCPWAWAVVSSISVNYNNSNFSCSSCAIEDLLMLLK